MGHADNYVGLMKRIEFERFQNVYGALSTAIVSGASTARIFVSAYGGVTLPKGAKITIAKPYTTTSLILTTTQEVFAGQTSITVESVSANADYPVGSSIIVDNTTLVKDRYRRYFTVHLNANFAMNTGTTTNDYLGTLSQGTFTSNGASIFADGNNKGNNFGGRYGMLNAIGTDFKIHTIKTNLVTNVANSTELTLSFWKKEFDPTGSSNSTLNLVCQNTTTGTGSYNQGHQFLDERLEITANGQFSTNDVLIPTIRQSKTQSASKQAYFDVQVVCSALFN